MALVAGVAFSKLPRAKQHAIFVAQRKQRATPAEKVFSSYLASLGLSYRFQRGSLAERNGDAVCAGKRVAGVRAGKAPGAGAWFEFVKG